MGGGRKKGEKKENKKRNKTEKVFVQFGLVQTGAFCRHFPEYGPRREQLLPRYKTERGKHATKSKNPHGAQGGHPVCLSAPS